MTLTGVGEPILDRSSFGAFTCPEDSPVPEGTQVGQLTMETYSGPKECLSSPIPLSL